MQTPTTNQSSFSDTLHVLKETKLNSQWCNKAMFFVREAGTGYLMSTEWRCTRAMEFRQKSGQAYQ